MKETTHIWLNPFYQKDTVESFPHILKCLFVWHKLCKKEFDGNHDKKIILT